MADTFVASGALSAANWMKNGNFVRIPRTLRAKSYPATASQKTTTFADVVTPDDVSLLVMSAPISTFLANWLVGGSEDGVGSIDFDPVDLRSGIRLRSTDSGRLLRAGFFQSGEITLEQELEVINQFRGLPATFAVTVRKLFGNVKVQAEIDFGSSVETLGPVFSDVAEYSRRADVIECPLDFTKIVVRLRLSARAGAAVGLSGACFALGAWPTALEYADNLGDVATPRGAIVLWPEEGCPPGFRFLGEAEECFLFAGYGDPNVVSGGREEYAGINEDDPNYNFYATREPETRTRVGNDNHFFHQRAGMVGDQVDEFESLPPDIQRRLATADFNDQGEPPGPGPTWSVRAMSLVSSDEAVEWPFQDPTSVGEVEKFKQSTQQNEVLPGGAGDPDNPGSYPSDVWRNPHKHVFRVTDAEALPPYKTFRFCEKI